MTERTEILSKPDIHAAWLLMVTGPRSGRDYRLAKVTSLGRAAADNDVILDDDAVSGEHARIRYENGVYVLYDLASSNGTLLNGARIQKAVLRDNDRVQIGHTSMVFKEAKVG